MTRVGHPVRFTLAVITSPFDCLLVFLLMKYRVYLWWKKWMCYRSSLILVGKQHPVFHWKLTGGFIVQCLTTDCRVQRKKQTSRIDLGQHMYKTANVWAFIVPRVSKRTKIILKCHGIRIHAGNESPHHDLPHELWDIWPETCLWKTRNDITPSQPFL